MGGRGEGFVRGRGEGFVREREAEKIMRNIKFFDDF